MFYNEGIDAEAADIALATRNPGEVNSLLNAINSRAYHYKVVYRGSDIEEVERIIGLNLVKKFFLRLQKLVNNQGVQELMSIVESSKRLSADLICFYSEVGKFTKCKYPEKLSFFSTSTIGRIGAFNVIDTFTIDSLEFLVLESHGGHIPGQVFFLNREHGLFFTSDYLINIDSLLAEEKEYMKLPRYLMTSTNTKSDIFKEETMSLMNVISLLDEELKSRGEPVLVLPGHGDYYRYRGQSLMNNGNCRVFAER